MNSIQLVGRLVREPEMRTTTTGKAFATFSIAVDKRIKPANGSEPSADFFNCKVWEKTADYVCNYLGKGRLVSVTGSIESRKYNDKEGNKREIWEVNAMQVSGLDRAPEGQQAKPSNTAAPDDYDPFE